MSTALQPRVCMAKTTKKPGGEPSTRAVSVAVETVENTADSLSEIGGNFG